MECALSTNVRTRYSLLKPTQSALFSLPLHQSRKKARIRGTTGEMSLLARLKATEARDSTDAPDPEPPGALRSRENADPRVQMMKEIQSMLDTFDNGHGDTAGSGSSLDGAQCKLAQRLKSKWLVSHRPPWLIRVLVPRLLLIFADYA
jgi:hypothetical protein